MKGILILALTAFISLNAEASEQDWVSVGLAKSADRIQSPESAYSDVNLHSKTLSLRGSVGFSNFGLDNFERLSLEGSFQKSFSATDRSLLNTERYRAMFSFETASEESSYSLKPTLGFELFQNNATSRTQAFIQSQASTLFGASFKKEMGGHFSLGAAALVTLAKDFSHHEFILSAGYQASDNIALSFELNRERVHQSAADISVTSVRSFLFLTYMFGSKKVSNENSQSEVIP
ncbi:MAG: hypothetical protein EOP06_01730 [Proteobacteria bacterium]|nr:MAG: hypothetical protein EOP06_01730 [Pseudomonadota bacterium]